MCTFMLLPAVWNIVLYLCVCTKNIKKTFCEIIEPIEVDAPRTVLDVVVFVWL